MKVLVDTSVWSLALRRRGASRAEELLIVRELEELIREGRAFLAGPIRQELLSGISDVKQYRKLRDRLRDFDDLPADRRTFETAAEFSNSCRRRGIQGSHIDFLICAIAAGNGVPIFTTDRDFENYAASLPLRLHVPRSGR